MSHQSIVDLPERLRDRDIFRDLDGRLFVALGHIQPSDRVLSYLKYVPDEDGTWTAGTIRYKRMFWGGVDSTVGGMAILPQSYLIEDAHFGTILVEPPRRMITEYFSPENRLAEILDDPHDSLEEMVKRAAETLHDEYSVHLNSLGVAGSILWGGHNIARSDINMNIYGFGHAWTLFDDFEQTERPHSQTRLRDLPEWEHAMKRVGSRIPSLEQSDLLSLFSRRRALCIEQRCIGITPVLYPEEAPIRHGSESYETHSTRPAVLNMTIENAEYGLFHPAIYEISPIAYDGGIIRRIMVYDGAFGGLFREGDTVEVSGTLQSVKSVNDAPEFYQIMVGTKAGSGMEYIRFV